MNVSAYSNNEDSEDSKDEPCEFYNSMNQKIDYTIKFINKDPNRKRYLPNINSLKMILMNHKKNYGNDIITRRLINDKYVILEELKNLNFELYSEELDSATNAKSHRTSSIISKTLTKQSLKTKLSSKKPEIKGLIMLSIVIHLCMLSIVSAMIALFILSMNIYNKEIDKLERIRS